MPLQFEPFTASAPGKVILSGEHAVVHGTHAVATVIAQRTFVGVEPLAADEVELVIEMTGGQEDKRFRWSLEEVLRVGAAWFGEGGRGSPAWAVRASGEVPPLEHDALLGDVARLPRVTEFVAASVFLYFASVFLRGSCPGGFRFTVRSQVPMSAGLGSSASFCTSLGMAFFRLAAALPAGEPGRLEEAAAASEGCAEGSAVPSMADRETLNRWAFQGERIIHGNPSGVDNTVSVHGGALVYRRGHDNTYLKRLPPVRFLVTNTRVPRDTKRLVAGVGELLHAYPEPIGHVITAMDGVALRLVEAAREYEEAAGADEPAAEAAFVEHCGSLLTVNQHLLNAVGVGHVSIDRVVFLGSDKYGLPTKLTGAGGGGCVISLVPAGASDQVLAEFQDELAAEGFQAFETTVGQDGVVYYPARALGSIVSRREVEEAAAAPGVDADAAAAPARRAASGDEKRSFFTGVLARAAAAALAALALRRLAR